MEELKERDQQLNQMPTNTVEVGSSLPQNQTDIEMTNQNQAEPSITDNLVTENTHSISTDEVKGEQVHHENWIPPEKRRPEDEFFDL